MGTRLRIDLAHRDDVADRRSMHFALRPHPITERFARLIETSGAAADGFNTSWSMGARVDVDANVEALNHHIDAFNDGNLGTAVIDRRVSIDTVDRHDLNDIHEQFETHLKAHQAGRLDVVDGPPHVIDALHGVNLSVHRLEATLDKARDPAMVFSYFTASLARDGEPFTEPLQDADYDEFTMEEHFGILYANYATTGKNLQHVYWTDDLDLLEAGGASPQRVLSSGVLAQFNSHPKDHDREWDRFTTWFEANDIARYGYELDDPRQAIGMIKLGRLVPTADTRQHHRRLRRRWDERAFVDDFAPYERVVGMTIEH